MIHNDFKKMFNGIIDNNLTQIHNLDEIEGLEEEKLNDKTRRKLEQMYKNMRSTINTNLRLTAPEILFLGTGVNLSLITLKSSLKRIEKTINWYNTILIPYFEEIRKLESEDKEALIDKFYELFSQPIDKPIEPVSE